MKLLCAVSVVLLGTSLPSTASAETELKRLKPASNRGFDPIEGVGPVASEARIRKLLSRFDDRSQRLVALPKNARSAARASSTRVVRGRRDAPNRVIDRNPKSAWVEAEAGSGSGTWLEVEADPPPTSRLFGVLLGSGHGGSPMLFKAHPRPREALLTLRCGEDGAMILNYVLEVADTRRPQLFVFGPNDRAESPGRCRVRVTTLSVYDGIKSDALGISELRLVARDRKSVV